MTDIVYWGIGSEVLGEYSAPKDVSTAEITELEGGIEVDWGGGDVEIIGGTSWSINPRKWLIRLTYSWTNGSNLIFYSVLSENEPVVIDLGNDQVPSGTYQRLSFITTSATCNMSLSSTVSIFIDRTVNRAKMSINGVFAFIYDNAPATIFYSFPPTITACPTSLTVTSNTGDFSERFTEIPPTVNLLAGGCSITIAYSDSTSEELPIDICPEWVRVRNPPECPNGTCLSCRDGDHVRCIDNNGNCTLVLDTDYIIPVDC